jgi:hypothetical protein
MVDHSVEPSKERRRGSRIRLSRPLAARVRTINEAIVRDLSKGGALIETGRALAPGSRCEVHLELGERKANAMARVARCHLLAGGKRYEAGIEFEKIDAETLAAIEKIVNESPGGAPLPGTIKTV